MIGKLINAKKSVDALRSIGDPNLALQQLMKNNPNMKKAIDYVNQNGGDPKEVCMNLFKSEGISSSEIESLIK